MHVMPLNNLSFTNVVYVILAVTIWLSCISCKSPVKLTDEQITISVTSPQPTPLATPLPLDLKGIDVGTDTDTTVAKLGRPLSTTRIGENPCGGRKLTYIYKGLAIDFDPVDKEKSFMVVGLQVTSGDWVLGPGIKLGISRAELEHLLGAANLNSEQPNIVNYGIAEGSAYFHFKSDKLFKIEWAMNMC